MSTPLKMPSNSAGHPAMEESASSVVVRAFREFLTLPTVVIAAFFFLAVGTYVLDAHAYRVHDPVHGWLNDHLFGKVDTTANLLGIVASGLITVTSIIVSLMLVAIQQSATAMSMAVFDQFLRRQQNQFYFGFFVGLALFSMLTLSTAHDRFNPVYGGVIAIVSAAVALYLLIILMYTTINQMRPAVVIDAIRQHASAAKERQRTLLCRTRRSADAAAGKPLKSAAGGYVTRINIDRLSEALRERASTTLVLRVAIGTFVASGDPVAEVRGQTSEELERAVLGSIHLERQRDLTFDPAYAVQQIETIAWTSISSAKSNPEPGMAGINAIRSLLATWSTDQGRLEEERDAAPALIVYQDDPYGALFDALESLAIAASESLQHQALAQAVLALVGAYDVVPPSWRGRADTMVMRIISTLGEHVLSVRLENALQELATMLGAMKRPHVVRSALQNALDAMRQSLGRPGARGERIPEAVGG